MRARIAVDVRELKGIELKHRFFTHTETNPHPSTQSLVDVRFAWIDIDKTGLDLAIEGPAAEIVAFCDRLAAYAHEAFDQPATPQGD